MQDKHNQLYEESFKRLQTKIRRDRDRSRKSQRNQFHPQINPKSEKITKENFQNLSFYERQEKFIYDKLEKSRIESLNETLPLDGQINPETQKPFFQPVVGRAPKNRNLDNLDIGNYLYEESFRS